MLRLVLARSTVKASARVYDQQAYAYTCPHQEFSRVVRPSRGSSAGLLRHYSLSHWPPGSLCESLIGDQGDPEGNRRVAIGQIGNRCVDRGCQADE